jgi:hypothetical protein
MVHLSSNHSLPHLHDAYSSIPIAITSQFLYRSIQLATKRCMNTCMHFVQVRVPWLATLSLLALWTLLAYITHKQTDRSTLQRTSSFNATPLRTVAQHAASSSSGTTDSASMHNAAAAAAAKCAALSNTSGTSSNADSSTAKSVTSATAACELNSSSKKGLKRERTRSFSDTVKDLRGLHSATKLRMLDALLLLALLPLAYLARQWYT